MRGHKDKIRIYKVNYIRFSRQGKARFTDREANGQSDDKKQEGRKAE